MSSQFTRFDPRAWQESGLLIALPRETPSRLQRHQPWKIAVALSVTLAGSAATGSFVGDAGATELLQPVPAAYVLEGSVARGRQPADSSRGPDIEKRLRELHALIVERGDQPGWLQRDSLDRVGKILGRVAEDYELPFPYIYASNDGELSAEWSFGNWEVDLTFDRSVERVIAFAIHSRSQEVEEFTLPLDRANAIDRIGRFAARFHDAA